ncbi:YIP1 family protein [Streptomyces fractus]|uniref:YIP1 family protein n=1 Tax=Streptomyces fractus TaxID=641806 RepID=UPI003CF592BE
MHLELWTRPADILNETQDRTVWLPAIGVSALAGVLAVLGADGLAGASAAAVSTVSPLWLHLLVAAVALTLAGLGLGAMTQLLAHRSGGIGRPAATVSMFMVILWTTDLPQLVLGLFLADDSPAMRALAFATWVFGLLIAMLMVRGYHRISAPLSTACVFVQMALALLTVKGLSAT